MSFTRVPPCSGRLTIHPLFVGNRFSTRSLQHSAPVRGIHVSRPTQSPRLVILGSGWGGYEVLRGIDKKKWDVTVVSPTNYFNFTPLLASCSVGTLEFRSAVEPVRRYSPEVTAYLSWCDSIDFQKKTLTCMPTASRPPLSNDVLAPATNKAAAAGSIERSRPFTVPYDKLIIAVGAYSQTFNVPGVKEHAHFLKDVKDARAIRARILECFEQAAVPVISDTERRNLLHFCVVGGGPTGVEFAAELHDLLHTDIRKHYPDLAKLSRISLFDVAPNILGGFDKGLQEYATKKFGREGIKIFTERHVEKVEAGKLFIREEGEVPFGLLVWSTGLAPNPLIESITEAEKDAKTSSLLTNDNLNVIKKDSKVDPDVFVIGDAAVIKGARLPATAQVANQKAKYLTKKLNAIIKNKPHNSPFKFHNAGSLAYLGNWEAVYDRTGAEVGKTKSAGRGAWLLWRSAYFTRTFSYRNKILVPLYWFMNWLFGRDLSRF